MKRENRTFWMDLPRADSGKVQRMMTLWREQPGEQVEQIAGNPAIEKNDRKCHFLRIPSRQTTKMTQLQEHENLTWTHC